MPVRVPRLRQDAGIVSAVRQHEGDLGIGQKMEFEHRPPRRDMVPFGAHCEYRGSDIVDGDGSIVDAAANKLGGTGIGTVGSGGAGNGSFQGQLYTIDRAAPTIAAAAITLPDPPGNTYVANTWTNNAPSGRNQSAIRRSKSS